MSAHEFGVVGLGRIGGGLALQALQKGMRVSGFTLGGAAPELLQAGLREVQELSGFRNTLAAPRRVFLYIPAGPGVDDLLDRLAAVLEAGDILVDGGNSYWGDSVRRHSRLRERGIHLVDVGTSGGVEGAQHGACFIEFAAPRKGHFQVESVEDFRRRVSACDFELISELRHAVALADPAQVATDLLAEARKPMRDDVRLAWFRYHYVEMRGDHRSCDNAINRSDGGAPGEHRFALLGGITRTLQHALRAAMVLDREPYRYGKWLAKMAAQTPTGAKLLPLVDEAMTRIGAGALDQPGPEESHPLTLNLKAIRRTLIDAARAGGIDEPWLSEWWLAIDKARHGVRGVTW